MAGGRKAQRKGYVEENNLVNKHKEIGIRAERVPLSGAANHDGNGGDIDLYLFGENGEKTKTEVKARGNGEGFTMLEKWLGDHELMFLKRNRREAMVVVDWPLWVKILEALIERENLA